MDHKAASQGGLTGTMASTGSIENMSRMLFSVVFSNATKRVVYEAGAQHRRYSSAGVMVAFACREICVLAFMTSCAIRKNWQFGTLIYRFNAYE